MKLLIQYKVKDVDPEAIREQIRLRGYDALLDHESLFGYYQLAVKGELVEEAEWIEAAKTTIALICEVLDVPIEDVLKRTKRSGAFVLFVEQLKGKHAKAT